jgi:hypothetical protein
MSQPILTINAADARAMFPNVRGTIFSAARYGAGYILNMGARSFCVMVNGEVYSIHTTMKRAAAMLNGVAA